SLDEALAGRGDALTIDDSTSAAGAAATLAQAHGHAVTLFINPSVSVTGATYFFAYFNVLLDAIPVPAIHYGGRDHDLSSTAARRRFRKTVKQVLLQLPHEQDRWAEIERLRLEMGVDPFEI